MSVLTAAAESVTDYLRSVAALGVPIASVADPGYASLSGPVVAVDAPTITESKVGLSEYRDTATVPVRTIPATGSDSAGLIALTDATLDALRAGGFNCTGVVPGTLQTGLNPIPVYVITVKIQMITER